MTRLFLRFLAFTVICCVVVIAAVLSIGRMLPAEDEIVFSASFNNGDSEIYRMLLGRQILVPLTRNLVEDNQPAWSPDGSQIAFVSNREGRQYTIYLMEADGRNSRRLTESVQNNFSPVWSPDSHAIAYVTSRQEFARQITEILMTDLTSGRTRRISIPYPNAISPSWSADSRHIAFTSDRRSPGIRVVYSMDTQTGDTQVLVNDNAVQLNPVWSPDGRYLLYSTLEGTAGIYLWDTETEQSILLYAPQGFNVRNPSWTPDGRAIVYATTTTFSNNRLLRLSVEDCLQQPNACTPQPLTLISGVYDTPRWRPSVP
ncbi:MAG: PD40 domain-containing protein [Anaerolineae bacterium]|nr:PD40 domain-containing protein [Anaerolineae bacterium]